MVMQKYFAEFRKVLERRICFLQEGSSNASIMIYNWSSVIHENFHYKEIIPRLYLITNFVNFQFKENFLSTFLNVARQLCRIKGPFRVQPTDHVRDLTYIASVSHSNLVRY